MTDANPLLHLTPTGALRHKDHRPFGCQSVCRTCSAPLTSGRPFWHTLEGDECLSCASASLRIRLGYVFVRPVEPADLHYVPKRAP
jgi:hypothetical protein